MKKGKLLFSISLLVFISSCGGAEEKPTQAEIVFYAHLRTVMEHTRTDIDASDKLMQESLGYVKKVTGLYTVGVITEEPNSSAPKDPSDLIKQIDALESRLAQPVKLDEVDGCSSCSEKTQLLTEIRSQSSAELKRVKEFILTGTAVEQIRWQEVRSLKGYVAPEISYGDELVVQHENSKRAYETARDAYQKANRLPELRDEFNELIAVIQEPVSATQGMIEAFATYNNA